ncbi:BamA/OMP85 family outer membrane protein [Deinococcus maricopensis]|uniref:Surface antigen (D15) n=1 Tax=Deinococcus maricopensis (strain DSM 21211 / LMG 22137 / NRRL B-23946 / LB-34) TaxID=709986 RepID=E8U875_DEIML|nr:POTRA domain-containing protein [Deinococcus maricopensis]ADV67264.1 surface antigen (D15) [Deinococcus maricopensis DSM 21211]
MRHPLTLAVTVALVAAPHAYAQTTATLDDIVVQGAPDLLANYLKVNLSTQPGAALSSVNLRQVEQDTLATGFFKTATASLTTQNGRDVLVINVTPNATISSVTVQGLTFFPVEGFKGALADRLNIAEGATLNTARIEQSKELLAQNYRAENFPFTPNISAEVKTDKDGKVSVTYVVDETAPVSRVEVSGNTLLPQDVIRDTFKPLVDNKRFTIESYRAVLDTLGRAYSDRGFAFRPENVQANLDAGVLKVTLVEPIVTNIDTSALGTVNVALKTKAGAALNFNNLNDDVRALSNATGKAVGWEAAPENNNPGRVVVRFAAANTLSGPVQQIQVSGNTVVPTADILAVVKTKVGDTAAPQLVQQDFYAIQKLYNDRGYEIAATPDAIAFENGTLTFNLREVRIAKYELQWADNKALTGERVITRELPKTGTLFNDKSFRGGIETLQRLDYLKVTNVQTRSDNPERPQDLTVVLSLAGETAGIPVTASLTYDTLVGFGGELGYSTGNFLGTGNGFGASVGANQNDAGQVWSGNINYTIPWIDIDFLDFREKRTGVSFNASSSAVGNQALTGKVVKKDANGNELKNADGTPQIQDSADTGRDYTVRNTGFGISLGRNINQFLNARVGVSTSYSTYYLEPVKDGDKPVKDSTFDYTKDEQATTLLPKSGVTTYTSGALSFDNTDRFDAPSSGVRADASAGFGVGRSGNDNLRWTQLEGGARTYFGFGRAMEGGGKQHVFAVRLNAGTILGQPGSGTRFSIGSSTPNFAYELRGYEPGSITGRNYFTASAEYRYDFGLRAGFAQGLYGVAFVDAGDAWTPGDASNAFNVNVGYGAGVQLNLNLGLNLRFDYGFSPVNNRGKFAFRIGNFW